MIPGVTLTLGGTEYTVPPLTLGQIKSLAPQIKLLEGTPGTAWMSDDRLDALADIVAAAVSRNYPSLTRASMMDLLDAGNATGALVAVLTGSGLAPSGEAAPAASSGPASPQSTPPSPAAAISPTP